MSHLVEKDGLEVDKAKLVLDHLRENKRMFFVSSAGLFGAAYHDVFNSTDRALLIVAALCFAIAAATQAMNSASTISNFVRSPSGDWLQSWHKRMTSENYVWYVDICGAVIAATGFGFAFVVALRLGDRFNVF